MNVYLISRLINQNVYGCEMCLKNCGIDHCVKIEKSCNEFCFIAFNILPSDPIVIFVLRIIHNERHVKGT